MIGTSPSWVVGLQPAKTLSLEYPIQSLLGSSVSFSEGNSQKYAFFPFYLPRARLPLCFSATDGPCRCSDPFRLKHRPVKVPQITILTSASF